MNEHKYATVFRLYGGIMKYTRRLIVFTFIALIAFALVPSQPSTVLADGGTRSGVIASGAQYDLHTFTIGADTPITVTVTCASAPNNTLDTILTIFFPGSDPSNTSYANLYNDDGGAQVCGGFHNSTASFVAPVSGDYIFRVDGFGSATGGYSLDVSFGSGCDGHLNLTDAVVGSFVTDAQIYSEPGVLVAPTVTIPAGKAYWVTGVDASGDYYRIYLQCSAVWVPVSSVGPNYDNVWNGHPLPTNVVN